MGYPVTRAAVVSWGVAIPRLRLSRSSIAEAAGGGKAKGERAVCNHDEDSLTMAVQAALEAAGDGLAGVDRAIVATLSPPCVEKSTAALVIEACDGGPAVATFDMGGSRRAGLLALVHATEAITSGRARRVLVVATDARPTIAGDAAEGRLGDAAVAFVLGAEADGALATIEGIGHAAAEVWDEWRREGEGVQNEDGKGVREAAFERPVFAAIHAALQDAGASAGDVARLALNAPDARAGAALAKRLGVAVERLAGADLCESVGDTGCAHAPLALASALGLVGEGGLVCTSAYGDGACAIVLRAGPRAAAFQPPSPLASQIATRRPLPYARLLLWRSRPAASPEVSSALLATEAGPIVRLHGARCPHCDQVSYPPARLCVSCAREGAMPFRMERRGKVFTFTRDSLFDAPDAVTAMAVVDLDGGGRVYVQATDCDPTEIVIDAPVELVLRRIHDGGGHPNYTWKCRPIP